MQNAIWILGGANIDIVGKSQHEPRMHDSNIGEISFSFGGVGRNIAEVCSLFYENVHLASCFSKDAFGQQLANDCKELGLQIEDSLWSDTSSSSVYLALLDERHDMLYGLNDMRILEEMDDEFILKVLSKIKEDDYLGIDTNMEEARLRKIAENANTKIFADPVSVAKCNRIKPILSHLDIFKPNQYEAEELSGISIQDEQSAKEALDYFLKEGVKEIIISLSEKGALLGTEKEKVWIKIPPLEIENATGGGDTLLGAYVVKRSQGEEPKEALRFAMCAATLRIEAKPNDRRKINEEKVKEEMKELKLEEVIL